MLPLDPKTLDSIMFKTRMSKKHYSLGINITHKNYFQDDFDFSLVSPLSRPSNVLLTDY